MTLEDSLFQAILAQPDDDAPRLVYADWLEEHATAPAELAHAEMIRVQCRLALLAADHVDRPALAAREEDLLRAHWEEWVASVRSTLPFLSHSPESLPLRRGFLGRTEVGNSFWALPEAFQAHAATWFQARLVPRLSINLGASPGRARVGGAMLLAQLAASPYLGLAAAIHFEEVSLDDASVQALAAAPYLGCLTLLNLSRNDLTAAGAAALASAPPLATLTTLDLSNNALSNSGAQALAAGRWPNLRNLNLSRCQIGPDGIEALANSPTLAALTSLNLGYNTVGSSGALALANSPYLTNLINLGVRDTGIGKKGQEALRARFGNVLRT
jgi:uncharacterized protein (TIGR02996 family)